MINLISRCTLTLCLAALASLSLTSVASADTRYISDRIHVPLRSGESIRHRIVHRGLPSGTRLELISENEETGYSKVKTKSGLEGYIQTQYLVSEPVARIQLIGARKELAALKSRNNALEDKLKAAQASDENTELKVQQLQEENQSLSEELARNGITVNAICPGFVETDMARDAIDRIEETTSRDQAGARKALERMNPQNRLIQVDEVAHLTLSLIADGARGINGQAIAVDGGQVMH